MTVNDKINQYGHNAVDIIEKECLSRVQGNTLEMAKRELYC